MDTPLCSQARPGRIAMNPEKEGGVVGDHPPQDPLNRIFGKNPVRSFALIFFVLLVLFAAWNIHALFYSGDDRSRSVLLDVLPGDSFRKVVTKMYEDGLTHYPETLVFWGEVLGIDTNIRSGEYGISGDMSPLRILMDLHEGQRYFYKVTIPEGFTVAQVAKRLSSIGMGSETNILNTANDPAFVKSLGVDSVSLEGYLFPDTYFFPRMATPRDAFRMMVSRFWHDINGAKKKKMEQEHLSVEELVTLASIVQEETGNPRDMPFVASVFLNRLTRHMRLQSDPTVIYALNGRRRLHSRDLQVDSPYNTYKYPGLPPTPISSPGEQAIDAVLSPRETPYLYFVSDGHGGHLYAETLQEQDEHIRKMIRSRKKH